MPSDHARWCVSEWHPTRDDCTCDAGRRAAMPEIERLKSELAEALRILKRRTGLDWGPAIYSRVMSGVRSQTCPTCGGAGETHHSGPISGNWTERCETCDGSGEVLE